MATKVATVAAPDIETTIKEAVKTWITAEQSAVWGVIKAVYAGLQGVSEADRGKREFALRTYVNQAFEENYGAGASKDRAAHISKIFKIALNATPDHFKKWAKEGTGFYKAYETFAVAQANPKSAKKSSKDKPAVDTVTNGTDPNAQAEAAASVQMAQAIADAAKQGKTVTPGVPPPNVIAVGAPIFTDTSASEMVQLWADRIDTNHKLWGHLIDHLTEPKRTILTPDMVLEVVVAAGKKPALLRNVVGLLLQNETIAKEVLVFIDENPTLVAAKVEAGK